MKTKEEMIKHLKEFFKENTFLYEIENVFLYGSWARGFPKQDSDIDIAVVFSKESLSKEECFEYITDISLSLSNEINLDVNVISIDLDFNKPMLYYNAIVLGEPIFIKDYQKYVYLKNKAIYNMEDFNVFGIGWQLMAAKKTLESIKNV
ncbi:MAG: nucleotidyltransferase domain-containing protein [Candidatus Firestonebacteria bacterium]